MGSILYLAHDDVPEATEGDDISICITEEMEKASHYPPDHRLGKILRRASSRLRFCDIHNPSLAHGGRDRTTRASDG
jgi:hypothetical protein